jgi:hypothetical protein
VRQLSLTRFNREVSRYFPTAIKAPYGKIRRAHWIGMVAKIELFTKAPGKKPDQDEE